MSDIQTGRRTHEIRHLYFYCRHGVFRRGLFYGRHRRLAALSGYADASPRLDQGRQPRPWIDCFRAVAAGPRIARRTQVAQHLGAGPVVRCDRVSAYCPSDATIRTPDMTYDVLFDLGLAGVLIAIAAGAIFARGAFVSLVLFMVYGLLLAIVWVRLSAVDVALTETAIGGGVTGMLLLGAASRLRATKGSAAKAGFPARLAAGALCILVSIALGIVVYALPEVPPTLAPIAKENLASSGLGNPVAGVLFVYRALDTLLEKVVLLLALVGVWSLAQDEAWGGVPGLPVYAKPGPILVFLAQILPPIGIIVGIYMFWAGASQPGGAFQGGTILAAVWLLTMMARLQSVPSIDQRWLRLLLVVGPVIFLAIGIAGMVLATAFLAYPAGYAKPLIVAVEFALMLSIGLALGLLAAGPPERVQRP